jgi:hypothetical protein
MRWFVVTVGLVCASLALPGWIYFRDQGASPTRGIMLSQARSEALTVLDAMNGPGNHCPGCGVDLLQHQSATAWNVRVRSAFGERCMRIDVADFTHTPDHGITGVTPISCP